MHFMHAMHSVFGGERTFSRVRTLTSRGIEAYDKYGLPSGEPHTANSILAT
jgi:hypothetical protein